jgi:Mrp family chromosome partitioning ATPase
MESLLQQAKAEYDLVVVDTPPLTAVSDAFPLLSRAPRPLSANVV